MTQNGGIDPSRAPGHSQQRADTDITCDVLVVGGGVNGTGIARDLTGRGLTVVLCEQDDLASGTSSASTKLIHGGLRYLEHFEFRLVREALIERERLLGLAPHIIWPMSFVLPHTAGQRPAWMIRLGLMLYDRLGGRQRLPRSRAIRLDGAGEGQPLKAALKRGFVYSDCWVDDARLVVLNAVDAAARGARVLTRHRCEALTAERGTWHGRLVDRQAGGVVDVRARAVVNAAGPWVDRVQRHAMGSNAPRTVRLVKGSHLVTRRLYDGDHAYLFQHTDGRVVFLIPYEQDYSLIGTTEVDVADGPDRPAIEPHEIDYLLSAVGRYLTRPPHRSDIVTTYSGVRPLAGDEDGDASSVSRDYELELTGGDGGTPLVLNVYGGKITTYRALAEQAADQLVARLGGVDKPWTGQAPLPGGDMADGDFDGFLADLAARYGWLPPPMRYRLARAYGTRVHDLMSGAAGLADLGRDFGHTLFEREVAFLTEREWARTADDILWRRTKLGLAFTPAQIEHLSDFLTRR